MADGTLNFDTKIDSSGFEAGTKGIGDIVKGIGVEKMMESAVNKTMELGKAVVTVGMGFESSMSQVAATMGITTEEIANGSEDFEKLSAAAKKMGATTQFSASNAADALNYLALAGYSTDQAIETLPTVLNLAAAGGMELGAASDMVTDAMSALGLQTKDASKFVDKMAKTSQKSNTSVSQLGNAILTVGATAKVLKGGTTELSTALGILADNGFKGSEGGTKLRNVIMSLTNPTDNAAEALDGLGVSAFDAEGNMRALPDILGDLNGALDGMSDEQKMNIIGTIFNKADIGAVNSLLGTSAERWTELASEIDNSEGAAASMAETMNANLAGALTILQSSLEGLAIEIYEGFAPALTDLVNFASDSVSKMVTGMQENGVAGAIAAAGEIAGGLANTFMENAPGFIANGLDMIENFAMGLLNGMPSALMNMSQIIIGIGSKIIEALPTIQSRGLTLVSNLALGMLNNLPFAITAIGTIITQLLGKLLDALPKMLENGRQFISKISDGIKNNAPAAIAALGNVLTNLISTLMDKMPEFLAKGVELLGEVAKGIVNNVPTITSAIAHACVQVLAKIGEKLPEFLEKGIEMLGKVAAGIVQGIPTAVGKIPEVISGITNAFTSHDWGSIGSDIVSGIASGITSAVNSVVEAAKGVANSAIQAAKNLLGIASPSKVFKYFGRMIDQGLTVGMDDGIPQMVKDAQGTLNTFMDALNTDLAFTTSFHNGNRTVAGSAALSAANGSNISLARLIELQEEGNENARRLAKRPIYLGTERIDQELPKGAVPVT